MSRKQISVLWLYDDLLDLFGDFGNLFVLKNRLSDAGVECRVIRRSIGDDLSFDNCDLIYIGPGKAKNLITAMRHFVKYKDKFIKAVNSGVAALVVSNARVMLGQSYRLVTGETIMGAGLFGYTAYETAEVFVSDVVATELVTGDFNKSYGYINRTAYIADNAGDRVFEVALGAGENNSDDDLLEGNHFKNLFATWMLGPVLVKNPAITAHIVNMLTGYEGEFQDSMERKALEMTLAEFDDELNALKSGQN